MLFALQGMLLSAHQHSIAVTADTFGPFYHPDWDLAGLKP